MRAAYRVTSQRGLNPPLPSAPSLSKPQPKARTATLLSQETRRDGEKMKNYYKTFCGILMSTKLVFGAFMKNSKGKQQRNMTDGTDGDGQTNGHADPAH